LFACPPSYLGLLLDTSFDCFPLSSLVKPCEFRLCPRPPSYLGLVLYASGVVSCFCFVSFLVSLSCDVFFVSCLSLVKVLVGSFLPCVFFLIYILSCRLLCSFWCCLVKSLVLVLLCWSCFSGFVLCCRVVLILVLSSFDCVVLHTPLPVHLPMFCA
jgi:hypothetical protein